MTSRIFRDGLCLKIYLGAVSSEKSIVRSLIFLDFGIYLLSLFMLTLVYCIYSYYFILHNIPKVLHLSSLHALCVVSHDCFYL